MSREAAEAINKYHELVSKVDERCCAIERDFASYIACRSGCDSCCQHISLFPVEAYALAQAVAALPVEETDELRDKSRAASPACPLLYKNRCLLYQARPIICRTHGLPLLIADGETPGRVDFCPQNFKGLASLPGNAIIDLERLNTILASINQFFCAYHPTTHERFTIAEALQIEVKPGC